MPLSRSTRAGTLGAPARVHGGAVTGSRSAAAVAWARDAAAQAVSWLIPVDCAGCGRADLSLCEECELTLRRSAAQHRMVGEIAVFSALDYAGPVVGVMRSLKADGRTGLARPLGAALRATLERADVLPGGLLTGIATRSLVPVAIPSSRAAFGRRGYRVVELVARHAGVRCLPVLRSVGAAIDQRTLGRAARERNTEGMFAVRSVPRQPVVLIDDVITTGATLRAAADVLRAEGATVLGAVTVASTPLRWAPKPR